MRGVVLFLIRIGLGGGFVATGTQKLLHHASEVRLFRHWGLPSPDAAVYLIAGLEVVCGLLVLLGLATRLGALLLVGDMLGAVATAGRVDGGFHIVAPPLLALLALILAARGGGRFQLVDRVDPHRSPPRG